MYRGIEAIISLGQRLWTIELMVKWLDRSCGEVSFRLAQVLTVHGCFNSFLHNIYHLPSFVCSFYGTPESCLKKKDSAYRTLLHPVTRHSRMIGKYSSIGPRDPVHCMLISGRLGDGRGFYWGVIGFKAKLVVSTTIEEGQPQQVNSGRRGLSLVAVPYFCK